MLLVAPHIGGVFVALARFLLGYACGLNSGQVSPGWPCGWRLDDSCAGIRPVRSEHRDVSFIAAVTLVAVFVRSSIGLPPMALVGGRLRGNCRRAFTNTRYASGGIYFYHVDMENCATQNVRQLIRRLCPAGIGAAIGGR